MITLYDADSDEKLGEIDKSQLQFLIDQLEEEGPEDKDYYINASTLEFFEERGVDPALLSLLRGALGDRKDMDIRWEGE